MALMPLLGEMVEQYSITNVSAVGCDYVWVAQQKLFDLDPVQHLVQFDSHKDLQPRLNAPAGSAPQTSISPSLSCPLPAKRSVTGITGQDGSYLAGTVREVAGSWDKTA